MPPIFMQPSAPVQLPDGFTLPTRHVSSAQSARPSLDQFIPQADPAAQLKAQNEGEGLSAADKKRQARSQSKRKAKDAKKGKTSGKASQPQSQKLTLEQKYAQAVTYLNQLGSKELQIPREMSDLPLDQYIALLASQKPASHLNIIVPQNSSRQAHLIQDRGHIHIRFKQLKPHEMAAFQRMTLAPQGDKHYVLWVDAKNIACVRCYSIEESLQEVAKEVPKNFTEKEKLEFGVLRALEEPRLMSFDEMLRISINSYLMFLVEHGDNLVKDTWVYSLLNSIEDPEVSQKYHHNFIRALNSALSEVKHFLDKVVLVPSQEKMRRALKDPHGAILKAQHDMTGFIDAYLPQNLPDRLNVIRNSFLKNYREELDGEGLIDEALIDVVQTLLAMDYFLVTLMTPTYTQQWIEASKAPEDEKFQKQRDLTRQIVTSDILNLGQPHIIQEYLSDKIAMMHRYQRLMDAVVAEAIPDNLEHRDLLAKRFSNQMMKRSQYTDAPKDHFSGAVASWYVSDRETFLETDNPLFQAAFDDLRHSDKRTYVDNQLALTRVLEKAWKDVPHTSIVKHSLESLLSGSEEFVKIQREALDAMHHSVPYVPGRVTTLLDVYRIHLHANYLADHKHWTKAVIAYHDAFKGYQKMNDFYQASKMLIESANHLRAHAIQNIDLDFKTEALDILSDVEQHVKLVDNAEDRAEIRLDAAGVAFAWGFYEEAARFSDAGLSEDPSLGVSLKLTRMKANALMSLMRDETQTEVRAKSILNLLNSLIANEEDVEQLARDYVSLGYEEWKLSDEETVKMNERKQLALRAYHHFMKAADHYESLSNHEGLSGAYKLAVLSLKSAYQLKPDAKANDISRVRELFAQALQRYQIVKVGVQLKPSQQVHSNLDDLLEDYQSVCEAALALLHQMRGGKAEEEALLKAAKEVSEKSYSLNNVEAAEYIFELTQKVAWHIRMPGDEMIHRWIKAIKTWNGGTVYYGVLKFFLEGQVIEDAFLWKDIHRFFDAMGFTRDQKAQFPHRLSDLGPVSSTAALPVITSQGGDTAEIQAAVIPEVRELNPDSHLDNKISLFHAASAMVNHETPLEKKPDRQLIEGQTALQLELDSAETFDDTTKVGVAASMKEDKVNEPTRDVNSQGPLSSGLANHIPTLSVVRAL